MNRVTRWVAVALSIAIAMSIWPAHADVALPGVESCETLPEGAPCYQRGVVPGHCVHESPDYPDIVLKRCRSDAAVVASSSPSASASAASPLPTMPPAPSASPALHHSMCSIDLTGSNDLGSAIVFLSIAIARMTRRRDAWEKR